MKITPTMFDKIEYNNKNSYQKIGYFDLEKNQFCEVARWRNSYSKNSGANYGLLQIWAVTFDFASFSSQGGRNTCGGYNKPVANLENCLHQFSKSAEGTGFSFSSYGSTQSLLEELKNYLQNQYKAKLLLLDCNG